MPESLCGVWVEGDGGVHTSSVMDGDGAFAAPRSERRAFLRPFAWIAGPPEEPLPASVTLESLAGDGALRGLVHAESMEAFDAFAASASGRHADVVGPIESQYLLQTRQRLYQGMSFSQLRRCQLDIETGSADGSFSDASKPADRVLAIGLRCGGIPRLLIIDEMSDDGEGRLLEALNAALAEMDPDVIEGHNIFKFDLDYLRKRCRRHKVPSAWGRFGQLASFRNSRLKVAERWIDFPRCDLPGRAVVDTYLLVQLYDITTRELTAFGLKEAAVHFGITDEDGGGRTYLDGNKIAEAFANDLPSFRAYLEDDLRETQGVADLLLPTYFEQTRTFPITLQEATLRGTTSKIDLLFLEEYYHARQSCPRPPEIQPFEGGYTRSYKEGVFTHVLHFDVASLYPSLLLQIGRNPSTDTLGVFIPLLQRLREYRLRYKQLAKTAPTAGERSEAQARQASFKILINSFYGYLGFSGARFGDGELAAEVTRRGRELLQGLIDALAGHGCTILEADTDGIYLSSVAHFEEPEKLLAEVAADLPPGIELEYDGRYQAMFCYKAKNYALYDGTKLTVRGSALRSRGIEPFLRKLTGSMIRFLVGASSESPVALAADYRSRIAARSLPVEELAKTESLSQNPDAYERFVGGGGKPRRASAEAALLLVPRPRMGERVAYYVMGRQGTRGPDWQRARPLVLYDPAASPYDAEYYLDKIEDWMTRYGPYLGVKPEAPAQGELF